MYGFSAKPALKHIGLVLPEASFINFLSRADNFHTLVGGSFH